MNPLYMCSGNLYAYSPFVDEEKKNVESVYEFNLKKSLHAYIYIYIFIYLFIEKPRRGKENV